MHTLWFKYPSKTRVHICLTSQAFKYSICAWLGKIHDCFALHEKRLDDLCILFHAHIPLEIVYGSDENSVQNYANEMRQKNDLSSSPAPIMLLNVRSFDESEDENYSSLFKIP